MKPKVSKVLLLFMLVLSFTGCVKEDDLIQEGNVYIKYQNYSHKMVLYIYAAENQSAPIHTVPMGGYLFLDIPLNVGNYMLKTVDPDKYYGNIGFQIRKDKTTHIEFDKNNNADVKYVD